jgi:endonuclease/exonuclease/phosphatase family metal-dependent hydrolase
VTARHGFYLSCVFAVILGATATGSARTGLGPSEGHLASQQSAPAARELRVMTFNIHHAEGVDGRIDVGRIAQLIRDARADVVGLQEVDRGVERSGRRDLLKEIADLAGLRLAFGKNLDHQGGDYGNALLTSRPIVSEGNRPLPNATAGEQRGVLQVVLDVDGTQVLVLTTHLDHRRADADRVASADAMLGMLQTWGSGPVIAMGDFNDVPGSPTWTRLTTILSDVWATVGKGDGFTIPVEAPTKRIDWILVRGVEPLSAEVLKTDASDHLPVAAVVRLR